MVAKRDFFIQAMQAQEFRRRAWVFSAFSLTREEPEAWKKDPYPFRIVRDQQGCSFVSPTNPNELIRIDDGKSDEALFTQKERLKITPDEVINLSEPIETTYGRLFFNFTVLIYPFANKIPYQNQRTKASDIEAMILPRLQDTPPSTARRDGKFIYVDEYLQFTDAMFYLSSFTQLWVPAATERSMTCHPDTKKLRDALYEEYKGQLHDPAVVAKIDAALVKFDKENWIKGDPSEGFLIKGKSFNIVRKKLFLTYGAEVGLEEKIEVDPIKNSLAEGWDISRFPAMNNSLRAGSFNRGANTMLGGESVKWLLRASSNIGITQEDCGTKLGVPRTVTEDNAEMMVGLNLITEKGLVKITTDNVQSLIGKKVMVRSPMFCKLDKTDYCATCVGDRLAQHPTGLSIAVADYGNKFLYIYMSAAHAKGLSLAKFQLSSLS